MFIQRKSEERLIETWSCGDVWGQDLYIRRGQALINLTTSMAMEYARKWKYISLPNDMICQTDLCYFFCFNQQGSLYFGIL